jgi:hypothetical protein
MTQYLLSVHHGPKGPDLTREEMRQSFADTGVFNDEIQASGHWVFAGGLVSAQSATVVDGTGPEVLITDGPYVETKEQLGGFWIIEAADLDEALALAARGSKACRGAVEVRAFQSGPPELD